MWWNYCWPWISCPISEVLWGFHLIGPFPSHLGLFTILHWFDLRGREGSMLNYNNLLWNKVLPCWPLIPLSLRCASAFLCKACVIASLQSKRALLFDIFQCLVHSSLCIQVTANVWQGFLSYWPGSSLGFKISPYASWYLPYHPPMPPTMMAASRRSAANLFQRQRLKGLPRYTLWSIEIVDSHKIQGLPGRIHHGFKRTESPFCRGSSFDI